MNAASVPPAATTSASVKSVLDSLSVNVIAAVSPAFKALLLLAIATVGTTVSTRITGDRLEATFPLPAASMATPAGTAIVPSSVDRNADVNVAEYVAPLPDKPESVPPPTTRLASEKPVSGSLAVNVIVAVSPTLSAVLLVAMAIVGRTVSILIDGDRLAAVLALPTVSVNLPAAIEIPPAAVDPAAGVKVAE